MTPVFEADITANASATVLDFGTYYEQGRNVVVKLRATNTALLGVGTLTIRWTDGEGTARSHVSTIALTALPAVLFDPFFMWQGINQSYSFEATVTAGASFHAWMQYS